MKYLTVVRYGAMAELGEFVSKSSDYDPHELLIIKTGRGTEIGEFFTIKAELPDSESEDNFDGKVIGVASSEERKRMKRIRAKDQVEEMKFCRDQIRKRKLPMKLKYVEHILGGERIIFYFTAEKRVDFRELVKRLAEEYKTRIEMRQIGARDEARLLEECGMCGRPLCCRTVLPKIKPVSMKMAKLQTSTLDPAKVSGRCGRLKCCFRYENDMYRKFRDDLPDIGDFVKTQDNEGEVVDIEVLSQKIVISSKDDSERVEVTLPDIIEVEER